MFHRLPLPKPTFSLPETETRFSSLTRGRRSCLTADRPATSHPPRIPTPRLFLPLTHGQPSGLGRRLRNVPVAFWPFRPPCLYLPRVVLRLCTLLVLIGALLQPRILRKSSDYLPLCRHPDFAKTSDLYSHPCMLACNPSTYKYIHQPIQSIPPSIPTKTRLFNNLPTLVLFL